MLVPIENVGDVFPLVAPYLASALEHGEGRLTIHDVSDRCVIGDAQLWVVAVLGRAPLAAFVTELVDYPEMRTCEIHLCGGKDMREWIGLLSRVEEWARSEGCEQMEIRGRKGWGRVFRDYREACTTFVKELGDG